MSPSIPSTGIFGKLSIGSHWQINEGFLAKKRTRSVHKLQSDLVSDWVVGTSHLESQVKGITSPDDQSRVIAVDDLIRGGSVSFGIFSRKHIHGMDFILSPRKRYTRWQEYRQEGNNDITWWWKTRRSTRHHHNSRVRSWSILFVRQLYSPDSRTRLQFPKKSRVLLKESLLHQEYASWKTPERGWLERGWLEGRRLKNSRFRQSFNRFRQLSSSWRQSSLDGPYLLHHRLYEWWRKSTKYEKKKFTLGFPFSYLFSFEKRLGM